MTGGRLPAAVGPRLLAGVVLAGTLSVLDSTVVVPLLSGIGADLGGGSSVSWLVSAYLLASTVTIPVWGRWLDLRGERTATWAALGCFSVGTVLAAGAPTLPVLIGARIVQGVGAGGLVPLGQAILAARCSAAERARLQVYYNVAYGLAAGLGPLVGGALLDVSWRWAFVLVLPFALAVAALLHGQLRSRTGGGSAAESFDAVGSVLVTMALVGILLAIERGTWWPGVLGAVLLAAFIARTVGRPDGLIPRALLRSRTVLACSAAALLIGFSQYAFLTYLPALSQATAPELNSGLVVIPLTVLWMTLGAVTGVLALRIGTRILVVMAALAASVAGVVVTLSGALPALVTASVLAGAAAGLALIPTLLLAQHSVATTDVGAATALLVLTRNFGGSVGVALTAVLLVDAGRVSAFAVVAAVGAVALVPAAFLPGRRDATAAMADAGPHA
jgi:MFS family permease